MIDIERNDLANVWVTLEFRKVPCADTTDALNQVLKCIRLKSISGCVDCDDMDVRVGSMAIYTEAD